MCLIPSSLSLALCRQIKTGMLRNAAGENKPVKIGGTGLIGLLSSNPPSLKLRRTRRRGMQGGSGLNH